MRTPELTDKNLLNTARLQPSKLRFPDGLTPIQRILLCTDGTVTDILQAYLQESVEIVRFDRRTVRTREMDAALEVDAATPVSHRHSLIRGKESQQGLILASSTLVPDRLPAGLKERMQPSGMAIGQALQSARIESFREILDISRLERGEQNIIRADGLEYNADVFLLQRTYRIIIRNRPCILIQERFSTDILPG